MFVPKHIGRITNITMLVLKDSMIIIIMIVILINKDSLNGSSDQDGKRTDNIVVIGFNQLWIDVEAIPCVLPLVAALWLGVNLEEG